MSSTSWCSEYEENSAIDDTTVSSLGDWVHKNPLHSTSSTCCCPQDPPFLAPLSSLSLSLSPSSATSTSTTTTTTATTTSSRFFFSWETYYYETYHYYYIHVVIFLILWSLTIFRREMSVNHCYHHAGEEQENDTTSFPTANKKTTNEQDPPSSSPSQVNPHQKTNNLLLFETVQETDDWLETASSYWGSTRVLQPQASRLLSWYYHYSTVPRTRDSPHMSSLSAVLRKHQHHRPSTTVQRNKDSVSCTTSTMTSTHDNVARQHVPHGTTSPLIVDLAMETQVHILSFVDIRTVMNYGATCTQARGLVYGTNDHDKVSRNKRQKTQKSPLLTPGTTLSPYALLWKTLWYRDYAWTVMSWPVGKQALARSCKELLQQNPQQDNTTTSTDPSTILSCFANYSRDFYFAYTMSFVSYVLVGHNTEDSCLVALNGHIYDMTPFLIAHPGSPETVRVFAGRDATYMFESIGHSKSARKVASSMCILVNSSQSRTTSGRSWGFRPTIHTQLEKEGDKTVFHAGCAFVTPPNVNHPSLEGARLERPSYTKVAPLDLCATFGLREWSASDRAASLQHQSAFDNANVYYDPFLGEWRAWYTNTNFDTIVTDIP